MSKLLTAFIILTSGALLLQAGGETLKRVHLSLSSNPAYGNLPLYFIPGNGRGGVRFYARTPRFTLWMTQDGLVFDAFVRMDKRKRGLPPRDVSWIVFMNANKDTVILPVGMTRHRVNYFRGGDPSWWITNIATSKAVLYKNLYKQVDLKVYGNNKQVEYDWIIRPGGCPEAIRYKYENVKSTRIDNKNNLRITTAFGEIIHRAPTAFQVIDGATVPVEAAFKITNSGIIGFKVCKYHKDHPLILDPLVAYATYFGGGDYDRGQSIVVDKEGNTYITGHTTSLDFPIMNAVQDSYGGGYLDVFVFKMTAAGDALLFSTYLGGSATEGGGEIVLDAGGNIWVTGSTYSRNFPTRNAFQDTFAGGSTDGYVFKLSPSGGMLAYSTYLGGSGNDSASGIAVDTNGNVYIAGGTDSRDFPVMNPYQASYSGGNFFGDGFVTKLSSDGTLVYSTYLGGSTDDIGYGIAVDTEGNAYVMGYTESIDFPTLNAVGETYGGEGDAFITKLSPLGSAILYSTFLGGSGKDTTRGIAVDNMGNVYVTGDTGSVDFPVFNPYQEMFGGGSDCFVTKLSPEGQLFYSTFLGGSGAEYGFDIAVDFLGNAYVVGDTVSADFPTFDPYQETNTDGRPDAFLSWLSADGQSLRFSTYLGGSKNDKAFGVTVDIFGNAYITGFTGSMNFPVYLSYQSENAGFDDVFVAKFLSDMIELQASRMTERAWLLRIQYGKILFIVKNPDNIPIIKYVIYRKTSGGSYQEIKEIPAADLRDCQHSFYDLFLDKSRAYTYKAEAVAADGTVVAVSLEKEI